MNSENSNRQRQQNLQRQQQFPSGQNPGQSDPRSNYESSVNEISQQWLQSSSQCQFEVNSVLAYIQDIQKELEKE